MKRTKYILIGIIVIGLLLGYFCFQKNANQESQPAKEEPLSTNEVKEEKNSTIAIVLQDLDDSHTKFSFQYEGETFSASFANGAWHIVDSYKIKKEKDMKVICQTLIQKHPVLGKDGESYRTAEDMVYEWVQHNLAYEMLPEGNPWRENAKDVDLDPEDQGKNLQEMYEARTGKPFNMQEIMESAITSNNDDN